MRESEVARAADLIRTRGDLRSRIETMRQMKSRSLDSGVDAGTLRGCIVDEVRRNSDPVLLKMLAAEIENRLIMQRRNVERQLADIGVELEMLT